MENKKRGSFSGGIGFVLAAAGSAVGLGNLWRFPYLAAQYGGGIFILVYIILALTFGFTLMTTEIAIGRKTKLSPTRAYGNIDKRFAFIGPISFIIPVIILPYYCVIGWVIKYVTVFATGQDMAAADSLFFANFIGQEYAPLVFFFIFLGLTALIVVLGVEKGIEKGIEQGIEQGKKENNLSIAKKMLEEKIPLETIIKITNLSKEDIENLK